MTKKKKSSRPFFIRNMKWFVQNITALHGVNQLASKSGRGLVLWTLVILGNVMLTGMFIVIAKQKYDDDAIVTKINANCNLSQVPFPAVSICNFNMVSVRESRRIATLLKKNSVPDGDIDGFFSALQYLRDFRVNSSMVKNYTHIMSILKYHYYTMDTIMAEVHQKCDNLLLYCTFNRKERNCSDIFRITKTLLGHCCTFNYGGVNDASDNPFMVEDDDFEYYVDDDDDSGLMPPKLIVTAEFGRLSGLFAVFDVEPDDYMPNAITSSYGAKVLVNDPYDFPETTTQYHLSIPGESADLKVEPKIFQVQNELRKVKPSNRRCWFHDEVHLDHTDRYSYETCNTECRMQTYIDNCGCVPYKYPKENLKKICELEDLKCLNNVTVNISKKEMNCYPVCYVECSDKKYSIAEDANTIMSENLPLHVTKNRQVERLSAIHVYYGQSSVNCYKLQLLIDINYFIVFVGGLVYFSKGFYNSFISFPATYGGVFSLSFGGSIITLVELLYLMIRFVIINLYYLAERLKFQA